MLSGERALKEYEALVKGVVPWDTTTLEGPIGPADGPIRVQMAVRPDGLPARTDVAVIARGPTLTRVRCVLHTGRTHQIRVHLAFHQHPVVGDPLYGGRDPFLHRMQPLRHCPLATTPIQRLQRATGQGEKQEQGGQGQGAEIAGHGSGPGERVVRSTIILEKSGNR